MRRPVRGAVTRSREERGQTSVLIVGFFVVLVLMVVLVVDASAAFLQRSGLDTVADGAALAAADALDEGAVYTDGVSENAQIDTGRARQEVEAYLAATGARARYPGLSVSTVVVDNEVRVTARAPMELPISMPGVADTVPISSRAAAVLRRS